MDQSRRKAAPNLRRNLNTERKTRAMRLDGMNRVVPWWVQRGALLAVTWPLVPKGLQRKISRACRAATLVDMPNAASDP